MLHSTYLAMFHSKINLCLCAASTGERLLL
jgi:hypothetical protein